jgi:hypothetical protein
MPNAGNGAWPAFWMDTTSGITHGSNLEVDILEWYGICNTPGAYQAVMQQASHKWVLGGGQDESAPHLYSPQTPMPGGAYPWQGYHIYGCRVTESNLTWYIDGVQCNQIGAPTNYMQTPFYLMVNYAIGGGWPINGVPFNTGGSSSMLVDWVRVWSLPTPSTNQPPVTSMIGVQFYENTTRGQNTILNGTQPGSGSVNLKAGLAAVAQVNWNCITGPTDSRSTPVTASGLKDSTGVTTAAALSANGYFYGGGGGFDATDPNQTGDNALASNQLLSLGGADAVVNVSQIPYSQYDIYVYLACDAANRSGKVSIGTTTNVYLTTPVISSGNMSQWITTTTGGKADYFAFTNLTGSSQTIRVNVIGNGGINGFQIVGHAAPDSIPLNVSYADGNITLTWIDPVFQLQSSTDIYGPCTNVVGAASPYTEPVGATQKFYRLFWNGQ